MSTAERAFARALFTTFVAACAAGEPRTDRNGTLTVLYGGGDEWVFSPGWDDSPKFLVYQPLVTYEAGSCDDITPALAENWERSDDWLTWTVRLKAGVRWHDGMPFTAEDIAFNVALWHHPDVAWYGAAGVDTVEVLDSLTVRVRLNQPGRWPLDGWDVFYPKHVIETLDRTRFTEWPVWVRPVGNGPFRYVRHVPKTMVELAANDDYSGTRPLIDRLILQFQSGGSDNGLVELRAGKVDLMTADPLQASQLQADPRFNVFYTRQAASTWLVWNYTHPLFSDARVRRALTHAMDRPQLHRVLGLPEGAPVTDGVHQPCQIDLDRLPEAWAHDRGEALRLLAEAGWSDSDRDGVLDRDGMPFSFTLLHPARDARAAVVVQDQLRKAGVRVELLVLDGTVVHQRFQRGDFEAIIPQAVRAERTVADANSPLGLLDPGLAAQFKAVREEPDREVQMQLMMAAGARYRELVPATFLYVRYGAIIANRRVQGIGTPGTLLPHQSWRWPFGPVERMWLDSGQ
jgi:peptide/nickel transport system substrate-binding protein